MSAEHAKHTPGPWQVNSRDDHQVCDCDGERRGCSPIAQIVRRFDDATTRRANARLIAAAPELLAALQALIDRGLEHRLSGFPEVDAARAAITKATGEPA